MSISHKNGIAISTLSAFNGISKAGLSAIGGQGLASSNGLLAAALAHWKMDESGAGNALDAHGSSTLVDHNGSTYEAVGALNGCRRIQSVSSQYFTCADNAALSGGDTAMCWSLWFWPTSITGQRGLISKNNGTAWEYEIYIVDNLYTLYLENGGTWSSVQATSFGTIPNNTEWHHILAWHDPVANTGNIRINNGTINSVSHSVGMADTAGNLVIGGETTTTNFAAGFYDEMAFFRLVPDSTQQNLLWNSGAPLPYSSYS